MSDKHSLVEESEQKIVLHHHLLQSLLDIEAERDLDRENGSCVRLGEDSGVCTHGNRLSGASELVYPVPKGPGKKQKLALCRAIGRRPVPQTHVNSQYHTSSKKGKYAKNRLVIFLLNRSVLGIRTCFPRNVGK